MPTWTLIAQTPAYEKLNGAFQLFIYYDSTDSFTVRTMKLLSKDFGLKRGSSSGKDKFDYITNTQIDFTLGDRDRWLTNLMQGKDDSKFQGVLKKDGAVFFKGNITAVLEKYDFSVDSSPIKLKLYDGLTRLQGFTDLSVLPSGLTRLGQALWNILDLVGFSLDIYAYMNSYSYSDTKPIYYTAINMDDYTKIDSNQSVYDVLLSICKEYDFNLFQMEGYWRVRQNCSMIPGNGTTTGAIRQLVQDGSVTTDANRYNPVHAFSRSDLQTKPKGTYASGLKKFLFNVKVLPREVYTAAGVSAISFYEDLAWVNGDFKLGLNGWTTVSGTPVANESSIIIPSGGEIKQQSGLAYSYATTNPDADYTRVKFSISCIRWTESNSDAISGVSNKLFRIEYVDTGGNHFYLKNEVSGTLGSDDVYSTWLTALDNNSIFYLDVPAFRFWDKQNSVWNYKNYSYATYEGEFLIIPGSPTTDGYYIIHLYGGAALTYNKPYEISAQHNYFILSREKQESTYPSENPLTTTNPTSILIGGSIDNDGNTAKVDIPFHDEDPFNMFSSWNWYGSSPVVKEKTISWNLDGFGAYGLLELIARKTLRFNSKALDVRDVKFGPGRNVKYTELPAADLDGSGTKYYLPIYEDTKLIDDDSRFILIEHVEGTPAIFLNKEYVFNKPS